MQNKINLQKRFKEELCTFEIAKQATNAGLTTANTYLSYDEHGEIGDGAWLTDITGAIFFPAINFPFALVMLEGTDIELTKVDFYKFNGKYFFKYKKELYQSENIVDALILPWIAHQKKKSTTG